MLAADLIESGGSWSVIGQGAVPVEQIYTRAIEIELDGTSSAAEQVCSPPFGESHGRSRGLSLRIEHDDIARDNSSFSPGTTQYAAFRGYSTTINTQTNT